ncbi:MAG: hypothetical protein SVE93_07405 [Candidatus Thermoplasmatota archaeon]|nr:hypothetical protein [Candidatus Thermoplasmatota archaeon]
MDLSELITIHVCTLIVIVVSLILARELWKRYRRIKKSLVAPSIFKSNLRQNLYSPYRNNFLTSSLLLFIYVFSILITHIAAFLYRFPTPEVNLVSYTGLLIPAIGIGGCGFIPYPGALFSIYLLEPKRKNLWIIFVSLLEAIYIASLVIYPPAYVEVREGVFEWTTIEAAAQTIYLTLIIAAVPVALFIAFAIKSKDKRNRAKGIFLAISFAMLAFFVTVCDGIGGYVPIGIRRVFIAVAVVLLYLGFVMPSWLSNILKV